MKSNENMQKFSIVISAMLSVAFIYLRLTDTINDFNGVQWFILIGTMIFSLMNGVKNIQLKRTYYAISLIIISITLFIFGVVLQIFK